MVVGGEGMDHTTVNFLKERENVMFDRTWARLQLCTHNTLKESLLSTATMCICLHPRITRWAGLFNSARTWPALYSMLGAQQMFAPGGPVPRKPAWTKITPTLDYTSILCLVVQVGQVTCLTSSGHWLTLWTLQLSSWRELDTRGVQSAVVGNVKS